MLTNQHPVTDTILAIDYGTGKCGLALAKNQFVAPLLTLENRDLWEGIKHICAEEKVTKIVLGFPEGSLQKKILRLKDDLIEKLCLQVEIYDEVLTTHQSQELKLMFPGFDDNSLSAYLILKGYLNQ